MAKKTKATSSAPLEPAATPRMLELYTQTVRPHLAKVLERGNPHAIPRLEKVVISMGVGAAVTEKKYLDEALGALAQIAGQKPIATISKVAVAGFKLRENLPIGCKVTLRGTRMYEFFDRLVAVALPPSRRPVPWHRPHCGPAKFRPPWNRRGDPINSRPQSARRWHPVPWPQRLAGPRCPSRRRGSAGRSCREKSRRRVLPPRHRRQDRQCSTSSAKTNCNSIADASNTSVSGWWPNGVRTVR